MSEVVVALYDTFEQAQAAVNDLVNSGYHRSNISLALNDPDRRYVDYTDPEEDVEAGEGAGFGAVVGGLTGLVAGLVAITIPGIGPIVAAGPLAAVLGGATGAAIGATAGAITGGITASLVDMGVPEDHAQYYSEALRRGSALVTVTADGPDVERAEIILRRHNSVDIERRASTWQSSGWTGFDPDSPSYTAEELEAERRRYANDQYEPDVRRYSR